MISILIPVYNYDVTALVKSILISADKANIPYQVIVMDDFSNQKFRATNADIGQMMHVNYIELSENIGRSKIRNKLAKLARYKKLIFLDCDSELLNDQYIPKYLSHINKSIVYGGRAYSNQRPLLEYILHWKYGREVEALSLAERIKNPVMSFLTNNFMCDAKVFDKFQFNEEITSYGYEDLAFSFSLSKLGYSIDHIENPIVHIGLDKNESFLEKQKNAIKSLEFLHRKNLIPETKLIKTYHLLQNVFLTGLFDKFNINIKAKLVKNLLSKNPKIYQLQLLKLYWFHEINKNHNQ